jgi:hypothetical protein
MEMTQLWNDIHRAASAAARKPSARLPDSMFLRTLGTDDVYTAPPQTHCHQGQQKNGRDVFAKNQAFSILHQAQEGRPEHFKKKC